MGLHDESFLLRCDAVTGYQMDVQGKKQDIGKGRKQLAKVYLVHPCPALKYDGSHIMSDRIIPRQGHYKL